MYLFHWYLMVKWVWVVCLFSFLLHFDLPTKEIIQCLWRRKGYRRRETVPKQAKSLSIFFIERSVLFCTVMQSFIEVIHYREIHLKSCFQSSMIPAYQSDFWPASHYPVWKPCSQLWREEDFKTIQTVFVKVNWLILWLPWSESFHQVNLHYFT